MGCGWAAIRLFCGRRGCSRLHVSERVIFEGTKLCKLLGLGMVRGRLFG